MSKYLFLSAMIISARNTVDCVEPESIATSSFIKRTSFVSMSTHVRKGWRTSCNYSPSMSDDCRYQVYSIATVHLAVSGSPVVWPHLTFSSYRKIISYSSIWGDLQIELHPDSPWSKNCARAFRGIWTHRISWSAVFGASIPINGKVPRESCAAHSYPKSLRSSRQLEKRF